jgi:hypothetical protein
MGGSAVDSELGTMRYVNGYNLAVTGPLWTKFRAHSCSKVGTSAGCGVRVQRYSSTATGSQHKKLTRFGVGSVIAPIRHPPNLAVTGPLWTKFRAHSCSKVGTAGCGVRVQRYTSTATGSQHKNQIWCWICGPPAHRYDTRLTWPSLGRCGPNFVPIHAVRLVQLAVVFVCKDTARRPQDRKTKIRFCADRH